ncbi:fibronectin type III domain-containing protein [Agromyces aerolatus]|uniref:fibronectin type III domain-containing protein n=1 Tax=Agromyces sp. LY-1074 TaxID=3074080 RepID=UPI00286E4D56|nr:MULTISPECIES: fibronectin type III domain-containing protein [unclassified Agromyces]
MAVLASMFLVTSVAGPAAAEEPAPPEPVTLADQVAEAAEAGASGAEALAESVGLPVTGASSLSVTDAGDVAVTVTFVAAPSESDLANVADVATVDRVYRFSPAAAVTVDPVRIPELQALPGVVSVVPVVSAANGATRAPLESAPADTAADSCRAVPVEADGPMRTALARETFGVDGTGVTIGIISDSYGLKTDVTSPEEDVAMGVLPGPGNPCGYETPVEVLVEATSGDDEGRGMAQLVHGIAPGAKLMFASGWGGPNGMAESIIQLAEAGADIIVDDLGYASETYFQQGLISVAINEVRAQGVAYYTSAGNANVAGATGGPSEGLPISAWQTPSFRGIACPEWVQVRPGVTDYDCLDFDPTSVEDAYDLLGLNGVYEPQLLLSWGEPINGVASSLELQVYEDGEQPELYGVGITLDPSLPNQMLPLDDVEEGVYRLVVVRDLTDRTASDPAVWLGLLTGAEGIDWREHDRSTGDDIVGPVTFGHPADGSGVGVAAADWRTPDAPESFTSPGPGTVLFEAFDPQSVQPAAALPAPVRIQAPEITGVDGTRTSFFGGPGDGLYRFFGTSAAAPNVAATHALATQFAPTHSADEITELMLGTAAPMTNPFEGVLPDEDVFGAGLADGYSLLAALPTPAVTGLAATALSATSIAAEWDGGLPVTGYQVELLRQGEVVESGTLEADATATTFSGLVPETGYRVRIAALNTSGELGAWAETGEVRTPRPPQPGTLPAAPDESALTPETTGGLIATPDRVRAGEQVTISGLPGSAWLAGWAYSTPSSLGWAWAGADGTASFRVPASLPAGAHRIAVTDESGQLLGWVGVTVLADAPVPARPAGLATTGVDHDATPALAAVLLVVLGGAALTVVGRRRARRS